MACINLALPRDFEGDKNITRICTYGRFVINDGNFEIIAIPRLAVPILLQSHYWKFATLLIIYIFL